MNNAEELAKAYYKIFIKALELRNLLAKILLQFGVIDQDNGESFYQLLDYISQIETIYPYNKEPNILKTFESQNEIQNFLYTNENTNVALLNHTIPDVNDIIINTFNSYNAYLKDYLIVVGLDLDIINQRNTLRHYIECLYQIERVRNTFIIIDDDILYRNVRNDIALSVKDDMDNILEEGTIIIRENGLPIYEGSILEAYIQPSTKGQHTYTFEYIPTDITYYHGSELIYTFNVDATPITIEVNAINLNENSIYYESNEEGYSEDEWKITIKTKDALDNVLGDIPIKLYIGNTLVHEDYTNIAGQYTYYCQLPYSSDFDDNITYFKIQTSSFNPAFLNKEYSKEFIIYHHMFEADNVYYINQLDSLKIRLVDPLTGEQVPTIDIEEYYDDDVFSAPEEYDMWDLISINIDNIEQIEYTLPFDINVDTNLRSYTMPNIALTQDIRVKVKANSHIENYVLSSSNGIWEIDDLYINYSYLKDGDVIVLEITADGYREQQTVNVVSNFILPKENIFYLPNQPVIYYKPLGQIYNGIIDFAGGVDVVDSLVMLPSFEEGEHNIIISGIETIQYSFTIMKPLELIQTSYDQTGCAIYTLNIYDKQSIDRLENHITDGIHEQYVIHAPNEISIDFINDGCSIISLYDGNINIVDIINEYNDISFNDVHKTLNKNNNEWNSINIKIMQESDDDIFTYEFYIDNQLKHTIQEQHNNELKIFILVPRKEDYRNFNIKDMYVPITLVNNGQEIDYVYTKTEKTNPDRYEYEIHVCRDNYNQGSNTICGILNGYSECDTFELYSNTFYILPENTFKVGNNNVQIKCFNENATNISIINNSITQKNITKNNDIFTINCDIVEAGELTITLQDNEGNSETFVINVAKGDYVIDLDMPETKEYQDHTPIPLSIKDAFNNEVNKFYCYFDNEVPYVIIKTNNSITLNNNDIGRQFDSLDMGEHTITVRTYENSNYNIASVTQEFLLGIYITSLTNQPLFTDLNMDNDGWLSNESMSIDNQTIIGDLEDVLVGINTSVNVDPGQLILSNFVSSNADLDSIILLDEDFTNIQNAIVDIDVEEDKLTYDTIEDDNL